MKINLKKLLAVHSEMDHRGVKYGLGDKVIPLTKTPAQIRKVDCSGYVRYLLFQSTDNNYRVIDGSQNQRAWAEAGGDGLIKKKVEYKNLFLPEVMADEDRLFIAFIKPHTNGAGAIGHVWLIHAGETIESHGGVGVNSRPVNTRVLRNLVYSAYELVVG